MPYLETPDELADAIADMVGIYGGCPRGFDGEPDADCQECKCRIGFVAEMTDRIQRSVANERRLNQPTNEAQL